MTLPQDPIILYSYINTLLRDKYSSLDSLCDDNDIDARSIIVKLSSVGFEYDEANNKFV